MIPISFKRREISLERQGINSREFNLLIALQVLVVVGREVTIIQVILLHQQVANMVALEVKISISLDINLASSMPHMIHTQSLIACQHSQKTIKRKRERQVKQMLRSITRRRKRRRMIHQMILIKIHQIPLRVTLIQILIRRRRRKTRRKNQGKDLDKHQKLIEILVVAAVQQQLIKISNNKLQMS